MNVSAACGHLPYRIASFAIRCESQGFVVRRPAEPINKHTGRQRHELLLISVAIDLEQFIYPREQTVSIRHPGTVGARWFGETPWRTTECRNNPQRHNHLRARETVD